MQLAACALYCHRRAFEMQPLRLFRQNPDFRFPLIFSFFDGLGGMAVVAGVWGFWDIIAGLLLAGWWARRPLDGVAAQRPGTAE